MPSSSSPPTLSMQPFTPKPVRAAATPWSSPPPLSPTPALTPRPAKASPSSSPSLAPVAPSEPLTPKQVRELRRLCRKTANRAQYDDRSVQVRQIASILAMGTPALSAFSSAPGARLQEWVDTVRADGADWRDERMLLPAAAAELRAWDGLLKAVAAAHGGGGAATPRRVKGPGVAAPGTPVTDERPRLVRAGRGSGPVAFDDSGDEESVVSGESEDEGAKERRQGEGGGARALRAPLANLSISQNGNFIDVELPRRGLRARGPEKDNVLRPRLPEKENALAARLTPAKARTALAPAPGQENAVPRDAAPRDWSALRGSRN